MGLAEALGLGVGVVVLTMLLPEQIFPLLGVGGAAVLGWRHATSPAVVAAAFVAPGALLSLVRVAATEPLSLVGVVLLSVTVALFICAIVTHVAAGFRLRKDSA